jgi:hypothetical protein
MKKTLLSATFLLLPLMFSGCAGNTEHTNSQNPQTQEQDTQNPTKPGQNSDQTPTDTSGSLNKPTNQADKSNDPADKPSDSTTKPTDQDTTKTKTEGLSFETAIIVKSDNEIDGVAKEYRYINELACKAQQGLKSTDGQVLTEKDGHKYDILKVTCKNGEKLEYYFQIDSFFGKF